MYSHYQLKTGTGSVSAHPGLGASESGVKGSGRWWRVLGMANGPGSNPCSAAYSQSWLPQVSVGIIVVMMVTPQGCFK